MTMHGRERRRTRAAPIDARSARSVPSLPTAKEGWPPGKVTLEREEFISRETAAAHSGDARVPSCERARALVGIPHLASNQILVL